MSNNNYNLAFYALVVTNSETEYDNAILKLVLYTIKKRNFTYISSNDGVIELCKSFKSIVGFEIPYFKMKEILKLGIKSNYLEYNNRTNNYIPDFNMIYKCNISNDMYDSKSKFADLVKGFKTYCKEIAEKEIGNSEANKIIANFIEEQGMVFFRQKDKYFNSAHDEYIFAKYLECMHTTDSNIINYVNELIVGRMYSELLFFDGSDSAGFNELTVYLDAGFIFRLLGYESIPRKAIYEQLLDSLHKAKIKTKIFKHTFIEVERIIDNSSQWINNPNYDPALSTEATYFFVTNYYTKEDVDIIVIQLRDKLDSLGIEYEDLDYPQKHPANVVSEKEYFETIREHYENNNSSFDIIEKEDTVHADASSLFFVDYLNGGISSSSLKNLNTLFLTTNYSLSKASRDIKIAKKHFKSNSIPFCVTDKFMSLILWKLDSRSISEECYNQLMISINAALLPNDQLFERFIKVLDEASEKETLKPEECYLLRTNKRAHNYLMEFTQGNVEEVTEKTPFEILCQIKNDAIKEGKKQERIIANAQIDSKDQEIKTRDEIIKKLEEKQNDTQISYLSSEKRNKEKELVSAELELKQFNKECDDAKKNGRLIERGIYFLCLLAIIGAIVGCIALYNNPKTAGFFDLFAFIIPFVPVVIVYLVLLITLKKPSPISWAKTASDKYYNMRMKKYGYSNESREIIEKKIETIKFDINNLKLQINSFMEQKSYKTLD